MKVVEKNYTEKLSAIPIVQAKILTKIFGDLVAVDNISFEVYRGECFGIPATRWRRENLNRPDALWTFSDDERRPRGLRP